MTVENAIFVAAAAAVGGFILWLAARLADRAEPLTPETWISTPGRPTAATDYATTIRVLSPGAPWLVFSIVRDGSDIYARCQDCGWESSYHTIAYQAVEHAALHNQLHGNVINEATQTIERHQ